MSIRVKKRWNRDSGSRSLEQMANGIAGMVWKLAANVVLNLENENFETSTQGQRLDVIEEIACYLVHVCDRWAYPQAGPGERETFISSLVHDMARLLEDSRFDVIGPGEYRAAFLERLNQRSAEYAAYSYDEDEGGSFAMRCRLGDHVQAAMGARDNRWIPDYIVGREAPEIEKTIRRSLAGLVVFAQAERT
ncbi:MAG: hypothetical protein QNJ85_16845 [Gammaproteobacteria bacterium]|nr:hypothetical protein [Gammaproteobacteria bacterium]